MKTKNIFRTVLFSLFLTIVVITQAATAPPTTKKAEVSAGKTVQRYFKFPSVLVAPLSGENQSVKKVEVLFTTDARGKVNFVIAKTDNAALKAEIEKQFYKMPFKQGHENVVQKVILNFKVV